jgi:tyrosyl-tRNA synthetase
MLAMEIPSDVVGKTVVDILVDAEVAKSNGEARRLLAGGAVTTQGEKVLEDRVISETVLLKKGKNTFILVR